VRKCSASSAQFADITRDIRFKSHGGGQSQSLSLEDLLHKPVARVQKNALVLHVSTKMSFVYIPGVANWTTVRSGISEGNHEQEPCTQC
jgi:hypothetical protein